MRAASSRLRGGIHSPESNNQSKDNRMKKSGMDQLVELWSSDGGFRSAFRADAKGAALSRGIALDDHEWQAVRALGMTGSSAALEARISPDGPGTTNGGGVYC